MLAYSGIAQAGYLLVGVAAFTQLGVSSLLFYTLAYGCANLAAFAVVLLVSRATGSELIEAYSGLAKRNPLLALGMMVALLSLAGLPLTAGFMAKFYVFVSAAQVGLFWVVGIGVVNSVVSVYYYLRVVFTMYVAKGEEEPLPAEPHASVALALLVAGVLVLGILPETALTTAAHAAAALFGR